MRIVCWLLCRKQHQKLTSRICLPLTVLPNNIHVRVLLYSINELCLQFTIIIPITIIMQIEADYNFNCAILSRRKQRVMIFNFICFLLIDLPICVPITQFQIFNKKIFPLLCSRYIFYLSKKQVSFLFEMHVSLNKSK